MNIIAIIPARGGSKGVPRKNIRDIAGKPLIAWTIEASLRAPSIKKTVVSTDDLEIAEIAKKFGAEIIMRPDEFATDTAETELAIVHALQEYEKIGEYFDAEILLQPTCPLRNEKHIEQAIKIFIENNYDSVIGIQAVAKYRYEIEGENRLVKKFLRRARRQEREAVYLENGAIYLTKIGIIMKHDILGEKIGGIIMDHESSVNIDDMIDFYMAEKMLVGRKE